MSQAYWTNRAQQNESKAIKQANTYSKRQKSLYNKAYKAIEIDLNDLLLDIAIGIAPTRSELWRAAKYIRLKQTIEQQANIIAENQVGLFDELLPNIFKETIESELSDIVGKGQQFNIISNSLLHKALDTSWSGKNYSDRIWTNRDTLARKLDKSITDLIVLGKSPTDIKKQIKEDFDVSYRTADRLIRTEASHTYNSAAVDAYRAAGIKQVKYLHGGNCSGKCDCHSLDGKIFDIGTEPTLPRHPNCICCYAPVVDLTVSKNYDIIIPEDMKKQTSKQLKKGIKNLDASIKKHEYKINNPKEFYSDWDNISEQIRDGRIKHWKKEIDIAKKNKLAAERLLKERGEL